MEVDGGKVDQSGWGINNLTNRCVRPAQITSESLPHGSVANPAVVAI